MLKSQLYHRDWKIKLNQEMTEEGSVFPMKFEEIVENVKWQETFRTIHSPPSG